MRKFAMLMFLALALATGTAGLGPTFAPAAHAYPTGPIDQP